jgi:nucleotide-binding universal stress UspA family protein
MAAFGHMKKALICLDGTDMDPVILRFGVYFAEFFLKVKEIHFVSAHKKQSFYEELDEDLLILPDSDPFEKQINQLKRQVNEIRPSDPSIKRVIMFLQGHPLDEILKYAEKADIDIVIMGKKPKSLSTGILAQKLTRKLNRSVLLVPKVAVPLVSSALIPVDFSVHSKISIGFIQEMQKLDTSIRHELLHVFDVPWGITMVAKTLQEKIDIMKENSRKFWIRFCEKNKFSAPDFNIKFVFNRMDSYSAHIIEYLIENHFDLLILGSKGQSNSSYFLLGSETERIIYGDIDIPILILKIKGENIDIWDAIGKLSASQP